MLCKKEKKTYPSVSMLLVGCPVGLDQFFKGKNEKGFSATIGWTVTVLLFIYVFRLKGY